MLRGLNTLLGWGGRLQSTLAASPSRYTRLQSLNLHAPGLSVWDAIPASVDSVHDAASFQEAFGEYAKDQMPDTRVVLRGRVLAKRSASKKLYFVDVGSRYDAPDACLRVQVMATKGGWEMDGVEFRDALEEVGRGDCVAVVGKPTRTQKGQLSLVPEQLLVEGPCLPPDDALPLPGSVSRPETLASRPRAAHLLLVPDIVDAVRVRAGMYRSLRSRLDGDGFVEVETPVLGSAAGGAVARPFATHHVASKSDKFLRIAPELHLKQYVVGGLDQVYELGKVFRNEGIDLSHLPEFSMAELYSTKLDLQGLMALTQDLIRDFADTASRSECLSPIGARVLETDAFEVVSYVDALNAAMGEDLVLDADPDADDTLLRSQLGHHLQVADLVSKGEVEMASTASLLDKLGGHLVEDTLEGPAFLVGHPLILSPLAQADPSNPTVAQRFEVFVDGMEIANGYNEITDPFVQLDRFQAQSASSRGDVEVPTPDVTYCNALAYGMPSTVGLGLGMDRILMLLTRGGDANIRSVVGFPDS